MLSFKVGEAVEFSEAKRDMVFVPANSKHSISNPGPGNLVAVFFKGNRPVA